MTTKEALINSLFYPVGASTVDKVLIDRGLDGAVTYESKTKEFELAFADILCLQASAPKSITEGGFSISPAESNNLLSMANSIYARYGVVNPYHSSPKVIDRSNLW